MPADGGDRRGRRAPRGADPAQPDRQRHRPRRAQAGADPDGRRRGHRRGHGARLRRRSAARRGEAGVQPVLALGPVAGAPLRRHRAGPGDQHRGRPAAPGQARGVGRAGQGCVLPADAAAGARPQGDDQPAAAQARRPGPAAASRRPGSANPRGSARETRAGGGVCCCCWRRPSPGVPGVPSSSAPQAIGTVDRPAPPSLPTPTPGMDPDVLLREFLKATADPANRHLAARQFLTESASQILGRRRQRAADRPRGVRRNPWARTGFGDHAGRHPRLAVRHGGVRDR